MCGVGLLWWPFASVQVRSNFSVRIPPQTHAYSGHKKLSFSGKKKKNHFTHHNAYTTHVFLSQGCRRIMPHPRQEGCSLHSPGAANDGSNLFEARCVPKAVQLWRWQHATPGGGAEEEPRTSHFARGHNQRKHITGSSNMGLLKYFSLM